MKCVKNLITSEIKRVSNSHAEDMVTRGWAYIAKKEWKVVRDAHNKVVGVEKEMEVVAVEETVEVKAKKVPGKKAAYRESLRKKRSQM